jgi:hypothetical protein
VDSVFLLWYFRAPDTDDEDELLVGVYSTEEEARAAIGRLKDKPGLVDAPNGFQIHPHKINRDSWADGFILD